MGVTKSWTRLSNFHFLPLAACLARVTSQLSLYLLEDLYHPFGHVQAHSFVTPLHGDFCAHLIKVQEEFPGQINKLPCLLYLAGSLRSVLLLQRPGLGTFVNGCVLLRINSGNISEDIEPRKLPRSYELVTSGDYKNSLCVCFSYTHTRTNFTHSWVHGLFHSHLHPSGLAVPPFHALPHPCTFSPPQPSQHLAFLSSCVSCLYTLVECHLGGTYGAVAGSHVKSNCLQHSSTHNSRPVGGELTAPLLTPVSTCGEYRHLCLVFPQTTACPRGPSSWYFNSKSRLTQRTVRKLQYEKITTFTEKKKFFFAHHLIKIYFLLMEYQ